MVALLYTGLPVFIVSSVMIPRAMTYPAIAGVKMVAVNASMKSDDVGVSPP